MSVVCMSVVSYAAKLFGIAPDHQGMVLKALLATEQGFISFA